MNEKVLKCLYDIKFALMKSTHIFSNEKSVLRTIQMI